MTVCLVKVCRQHLLSLCLYDLNIFLLSSAGTLALQNPLETALLLSLSGVGCIVLNQWHSSFQQNTHNVTAILDSKFGACILLQAEIVN